MLDLDAPQAVALNAGTPQRFPTINGFVLVPNELGALVGIVSWLGVEKAPYPKRTGFKDFGLVDLPYPLRKLSIVPLGTLRMSPSEEGEEFELHRGVQSFPSVGDPVHLPTAEQLRALVEARGSDRRVTIGESPLGADAPVSVDPDKLFGRHLAVLGNTGSGKSCSVAGLIRFCLESASDGRKDKSSPVSARFIVLDPNGEYRHTFDDLGPVRRFEVSLGPADEQTGAERGKPLNVPAWLWNSQEWSAFAQASSGTQRPLLIQGLRNMRAGATADQSSGVRLARLAAGHAVLLRDRLSSPAFYTGRSKGAKECGTQLETLLSDLSRYLGETDADEELQALIGEISSAVQERRDEWEPRDGGVVVFFGDFTEGSIESMLDGIDALLAKLPEVHITGGPSEDTPLPFDPMELADHLEILARSPEFSQASAWAGTLLLRIRSMLNDPRLGPISVPEDDVGLPDWLGEYIGNPDGSNGSVAILDLSMVPADVLHVVVSVIGRVVFEATQRYRRVEGRELPTVLVLEEAHTFVQRYLPDEATSLAARTCRETFEKIAREGRKFGLGLVLSSQRPSELSPTVLAQCNTFLLHRLVNDLDQQLVARLVPDNLGGLLRDLPSMPSRQAILLGWAAPVPVLVMMGFLEKAQRPHSSDPEFWDVWTGHSQRETSWGDVATAWTDFHGQE